METATEEQVAGISTAPRVTPADIEANIVSEHYFLGGDGVYGDARKRGDNSVQTFPASLDLLTFCVLVLRNGFTVTGESACASPENFDAEVGRKIARANAVNKVWPLMGYALKHGQRREHQDGFSRGLAGLPCLSRNRRAEALAFRAPCGGNPAGCDDARRGARGRHVAEEPS
jgi:hypothetical protein